MCHLLMIILARLGFMGTCPMLELPNFTLPFILECDASGEGIGEVLMQGGHPIVFESRKLSQPERLYSIYDKEMLASGQ
jgi:hypothetical protein